jgi:HPt (histidine-containing phosphotransfer) domain-containing protein
MQGDTDAGGRDQAPLTSRYASDRALRPLVLEFVAELPPAVDALESAGRRGDLAELARLAHRLKGEAATYGYPDLARSAAAVEAFAAREAPAPASTLAPTIAAMRALILRAEDGLRDGLT